MLTRCCRGWQQWCPFHYNDVPHFVQVVTCGVRSSRCVGTSYIYRGSIIYVVSRIVVAMILIEMVSFALLQRLATVLHLPRQWHLLIVQGS